MTDLPSLLARAVRRAEDYQIANAFMGADLPSGDAGLFSELAEAVRELAAENERLKADVDWHISYTWTAGEGRERAAAGARGRTGGTVKTSLSRRFIRPDGSATMLCLIVSAILGASVGLLLISWIQQ